MTDEERLQAAATNVVRCMERILPLYQRQAHGLPVTIEDWAKVAPTAKDLIRRLVEEWV